MSGVSTIPFGVPFAAMLARGLWQTAEQRPESLARQTLFLPNRRAERAIRDAFLHIGPGALLLPRMRALGDVEEDILARDMEIALGSAVDPVERELLLARLIQAQDRELGTIQALSLARELAGFLDEMQLAGADPASLQTLALDRFAQHWQKIVVFLRIVTDHWPRIKEEGKRLDAVERRTLFLDLLRAQFTHHPPTTPVIAAGSTGSVPASARLLATIATLAQGHVILPGFDRTMSARDEEEIRASPSHPQAGMLALLDSMDLRPRDVGLWRGCAPDDEAHPRAPFVRLALLPAGQTDCWQGQKLPTAVTEGLFRIDCAHEQEEAHVIALILRHKISQSGIRAALITHDRKLARRVASELRQWNIRVDDSAGTPLPQTPPGAFLLLLAEAVGENFAPIPLLALLKHPFFRLGRDAGAVRMLVRRLEIYALRGPRPRDWDAVATMLPSEDEKLAIFWRELTETLRIFDATRPDMVPAFIALAERLSHPDLLWQGDDGMAAAQFFDDLASEDIGQMHVIAEELAPFLRHFMSQASVRPQHGIHPRLAIWGPLEARLQQIDCAVLGGLNDGNWPSEPAIDPWLSPEMRAALGLPSRERRIGQAAHDFQQALGWPEVYLTRARRETGSPTEPSRFLLRLDALARCAGVTIARADQYLSWARQREKPERYVKEKRPRPVPGRALCPAEVSVTQIETWLRNPYALYAKAILDLRPLPPLDQEASHAELGTMVHEWLDKAVAARGPDGRLQRESVRAAGLNLLKERVASEELRLLWARRIDRIAGWFCANWNALLPSISDVLTEQRGECQFGTFHLRGRADRIDYTQDGTVTIVDYKTGQIPARYNEGAAPQLPLEGLLFKRGGFPGLDGSRPVALSYWHVSGRKDIGTILFYDDPTAMITQAEAGLAALFAHYASDTAEYWASDDDRSDYAHLARVGEWSLGE
ncbi:MAG TPA: PD-(D/E)XK nuclease family protein [Dongiaceae bacterium]|nr:PD-(D/E)XK nuclease family protein [Dongiaceae bacterium]